MQYPLVLTLKDGKNETIFNSQDFEYLLEQYMGHEAVQYFRSLGEAADEDLIAYREIIDRQEAEILSLKQKIMELESDFHDQ